MVATVHATEAGRHQGWLPEPLNRSIHSIEWWLTAQAHRVIACSAYMRWEVSRLFEVPTDRVDVVPNGLDPVRWLTSPEEVAAARARWAPGEPLVSYTGRLVYEKGVQHLLAAVPRLRRRHPALRVVVAGTGPEEAALRQQARTLRLGRAVDFAGFIPDADLAALVAAADCAVVPSVYEPFGLVALEAAAAGTPAVVADVGGLREFVEHRRTGLRFAAGDPAALAGAVDEVLRDEVLRRRLVREARAALDRDHAWATVAERTVEVYRRAAATRSRTGRTLPGIPARDRNLLTGSPG
jgi:glycogen(starch) synthase